jgi:glycosyltransferase involved in cell wall biosynthesis
VTMIVNVDIQSAIAQRAGVGRYTHMLALHLGEFAGPDELRWFYFDFKRKGSPFPRGVARERAIRWVPGRWVQGAWKKTGFPPYDWFAGRADVYHFPNFILPPLWRGKSVVTVHDVSFLRFPETTEEKNLAYLTAHIRRTVRRADAIITDSQAIAGEIEEWLSVPRERIVPIHLGISPELTPPSAEAVAGLRKKHALDRPYLLMVGTLEPRKNISFLVEVFERMESFDGDLVLCGMRGWKCEPILERIARSPRRERIRRLDFVGDEDLPALYGGASALVFPSLYEGFGFPPLEAMACGTPVISSPSGSLAEVLGDAAERVDGYDAEEWAGRVERLLGDAGLRARCVARGLEHARKFDWRETARRTWEVYRSL